MKSPDGSTVSTNGAGANSAGATIAAPAPRPISGGAPGSASSSASRGGVAGSGGATHTVQWKGKTLNMDTTRSALSEAAAQEAQAAATSQSQLADSQVLHEHVATILTGMDEMCGGLQEIYGVLHRLSERDTAGEKVFNTLHAELSDYKKDFIYEHLKPVVRPLLFLYDSLEQFEGEIERFDPATPALVPAASISEKSGAMPTRLVRQNTIYFREQLTEALRICEVTPMDDPNGVFNPRFHKAVKIVPVEAAQDGHVLSVVRSGWFLNGQLLRPAEVVVGKRKINAV